MPKVIGEVDGIKVSYTRDSLSSSPLGTMVFLHGWGGSSQSWKQNVSVLSRSFDCIALDMPGFGVSGNPNKVWGVIKYAQFVKSFIQALNLPPCTLIGKSFGGRVAILFASKWPEKLTHLILVSSAGIEKKSIPTRIRIAIAKAGKAILSPLGPKRVKYLRSLYYKVTNTMPDQSEYKWEVKKLITNCDLTGPAELIATPTLIIWGNHDKVLPLSMGKELNMRIKGSRLQTIPGGHNAHQESAEEFNTLVAQSRKDN